MSHSPRILVALGGRDHQHREFEWAAAEARERRVGVDILRAVEFGNSLLPWHSPTERLVMADLHAEANRLLDDALGKFSRLAPDVEVAGSVRPGVLWQVVTESADDHALTVLGTRRLGSLGAALGSVSSMVAARAKHPVVVLNCGPGMPAETPAVVIGLTGGPLDHDLLSFGFEYADRHARPVDAVFCWPPDLLASMQWRPEHPPPERAARWLAETVAGWREKYPSTTVHRTVVRAHPVEGLVSQSHSQELLVVGARARHPRLEAPLGSVSQGVLHHATCPVAIIH